MTPQSSACTNANTIEGLMGGLVGAVGLLLVVLAVWLGMVKKGTAS
jgi:hypothetical protein